MASAKEKRAGRLQRAQLNLSTISEQQEAFLDGLKQQVVDVKDVCNEILTDDYTPKKALADMSALWINGIYLVTAALYGRGIPDGDEQ